MTISSTNSRNDYTGSASLVYPYTFLVFADSDLEVLVDDVLQTLTTNYTVSGAGTDGGGNVTFLASVNGKRVALVRNVASTQGVDLVANGPFNADTVERALDRCTALAQQNEEALARAPKLATSSTESDVSLDNLTGNAAKFAQVNPTEDGIIWTDANPSTVSALSTLLTVEDSRTNSVAVIATHKATTSGTPAAGIGTGEKFQAESADEVPCDVGQIEFALSDVTAGSEDSYFQVLIRRAGAALAAAWKFAATGTFKATLTHANTADRTYNLPDVTGDLMWQGASGETVYSGSNFSSGNVAYTPVTGVSVTITTKGGKVLVIASYPASAVVADAQFILNQDSSADSLAAMGYCTTGGNNLSVTSQHLFTPAAGAHTYQLRAKTGAGGTVACNMASNQGGYITAIELAP